MSKESAAKEDLRLLDGYIREKTAFQKVCDAVRAGEYVAILGPKFCGKTYLIKDVLQSFFQEGNYLPVYLDFEHWQVFETRQFYTKLAELIQLELQPAQEANKPSVIRKLDSPDGLGLFRLLVSLMKARPGTTCLLAFNHIEALPHYLTIDLISVVGLAYIQRATDAVYQQVVVLAAGATNLYELARPASTAKQSPFILVSIPDASKDNSLALINRIGEENQVSFSGKAKDRILEAAQGDLYLIEYLCLKAIGPSSHSIGEGPRMVYQPAINHAITSLKTRSESEGSGIKNRLESIETDPDILKILPDLLGESDGRGKEVRRRSLPTGVDKAELTGLLRVENNCYVIRNELCKIILFSHFSPLRMARLFSFFARWQEAVDCFEQVDLQQNPTERGEYLNAVVNLVNNQDDEDDAFQKIYDALQRGFHVRWMNLYRYDPGGQKTSTPKLVPIPITSSLDQSQKLHILPEPVDLKDGGALEQSEQIEVRAFMSGNFLLEETDRRVTILAFPIEPQVGLVTIYEHFAAQDFPAHKSEVNEIVGLLAQAGLIIQRMRERDSLRKSEQQRADLMTSMNEVTRAITAVLDLDDLLKLVVERTQGILQAGLVSLYLYDAKSQKFDKPIAIGQRDKNFAQKALPRISGKVAGEIIKKRKYIILDAATIAAQPVIKNEGIVSAVGFPLLSAEQPLGILFVNYRTAHNFSEYECQTIGAFADQAAIAIQNARLYNQVTTRARQLAAISKVATEMRSQDDPDLVLRLALTGITCGEGLGFSRAMLFVVDEEAKVLQGKAAIGALTEEEAEKNWENAKGLSLESTLGAAQQWSKDPHGNLEKEVQKIVFPLERSQGAPAISILDHKTMLVQDAHKDPDSNPVIAEQLHSDYFAVVPLVAKGRPLGALVVDQQFLKHPITEGDLHMVETLADLAAIAIQNASLVRRLEGFGEIAHQLRSPLTEIRGFIQLLMDGVVKDPERVQEYYQIVLAATVGFESSVNHMLSQKKIEAGLYEIQFREVSLTKIIRNVLRLNRFNATMKQINIVETLDHRLDVIWADEEKLTSAIQVLVENAIKFSYDGGEVRIETGDDPQEVWINVKDKGHGIPDHELKHLWERYFRGSIARAEQIDGVGLGLTIAKYIIDGHHGHLSVESKLDQGSTFTIRLPRSGGE